MIKYKIKTATVMCTLLNTETGDTQHNQFPLTHPIKVFNERTKKRVLKEINTEYIDKGSNFKAIFIKSYENSESVMGMELDEFLKYAKEVK